MKSYLYSISHREIPVAQQVVQGNHASLEYAYQFGRPADHHPSLVHLTVKSKQDLELLRDHLNSEGIATAEFHETYRDWGLTSISCSLIESQRNMLSHLPLWRVTNT